MQLLLLYFCLGVVPSGMDSLWNYHLNDLKENLATGNFFQAKRNLAYLFQGDPSRYRLDELDLTAALIAVREQNWDSALRFHDKMSRVDALLIMEKTACLERLGRFREALDQSFAKGVKYSRTQLYALRALRARCYQHLGERDQALKILKTLTAKRVPSAIRMQAFQSLVELYYQGGNSRRGRKFAEAIQKEKPASDAALYTLFLQEAREDKAYLEATSTLVRFAQVCFRNRNFQRSDGYYQRVLEKTSRGKIADRARYFLALTHLKQGRPQLALDRLESQWSHLARGSYEGQAAFQMARALFMTGRDEEVIDFVNRFSEQSDNVKWKQECLRLAILALRRSEDGHGFRSLYGQLQSQKTPRWLYRYFYRNGVTWAMQDEDFQQAKTFLDGYVKGRMSLRERHEAELWRGLITWKQGQREEALEAWLSVAQADPNHYFGLVCRELIRNALPRTTLWDAHWSAAKKRLEDLSPRSLVTLYYLAPDQVTRERLAAKIGKAVLQFEEPERAPWDETASRLARIGRFGWAASALKKPKREKLRYHFLKSTWYRRDQSYHSSIRNAEILVNGYPRWLPYELLPPEVQKLYFPMGFEPIIREKATHFQVDPYLLLAIIREESRFDTHAKSWASARGLMQFIPDTAREMAARVDSLKRFSLPMLYEPQTAITLGAKYIDHLMKTYDGVSLYTVAAYNAGEGAVDRWRGISQADNPVEFVWDVTYNETKNYCQKVLRTYHHYTRVYENETTQPVILAPDLEVVDRSTYSLSN